MKILVRKSDMVAVRAFQDSENVVLDQDKYVSTRDIVYGVGRKTHALYQNVTLPEGFAPEKFFYNGSVFAPNPDWKDPATVRADEDAAWAGTDKDRLEKLARETR